MLEFEVSQLERQQNKYMQQNYVVWCGLGCVFSFSLLASPALGQVWSRVVSASSKSELQHKWEDTANFQTKSG